MQTVEIGADTKSCRDISRLFKDYLVRSVLAMATTKNSRLHVQVYNCDEKHTLVNSSAL